MLEAPAARLLDTLLQGRAWIVLIGALLTGIVFFNVSLLGLNQGITRNSERAQALQQQNAQLRLQVADLASTERIVNLATRKGMVMPAAGKVTYLRSHPRADARRALALIEAPSPSQSAVTPSAVGSPTPTQAAAPVQAAAPAQAAVQPTPAAP